MNIRKKINYLVMMSFLWSSLGLARNLSDIEKARVESLSAPMIAVLQSMVSGDRYGTEVREFGKQLSYMAEEGPVVAQKYLAYALDDLRKADTGGYLENERNAEKYERVINNEIDRRSKKFPTLLAVTSGIVIGAAVGLVTGAVATSGNHPMEPGLGNPLVAIVYGFLGGGVAGGAVFYFLNEDSHFVESEYWVDVDPQADELYNLAD